MLLYYIDKLSRKKQKQFIGEKILYHTKRNRTKKLLLLNQEKASATLTLEHLHIPA